jgi:DNA invertase Pin-like site-specific DNA recombinase
MSPERQFVDDGISGATLVRPALDRLRDLVAVGAIDRIYVHSPDRLARNYAYQVLLLDEWRRANVELIFLNRPLGQSPEDDLLLQMQGIIAEYERAKFMERSRRGKRHAAQSGSLSVMSGAPFGYRYISVREGGGQARFEPNAEQARNRSTNFLLDRTRPLQSARSLSKATESGRLDGFWKGDLVQAGGLAHSSKSRLYWPGGLRQNPHDTQNEEDSPPTAARTANGTTEKQDAGGG